MTDSKSKKHIERWLSRKSKVFLPGEKIFASSNTVLITANRLLQLTASGKIKDEILIEAVKEYKK